MKIRTQFFILIAGIIVVPLFVIFAGFGITKLQEKETAYVPDYDQIAASAGGAINRSEWKELSAFISRRKPDFNFIVLGDDRRVIYSSTKDFGAGMPLSDERLMDTIRETGNNYFYIFDAPVNLRDKGIVVIGRIDRDASKPPRPLVQLLYALIGVLAVVFVFSAIMSLLIARSIYRSVTVLEAGTKRIASGELDLEVDVRGSNEITSLTASLNRMRLALKDEETRRSRFIMGVSHDLKTPLALIKGYAEAIGDGMADDPESLEKSVEIIGSKVDQLEGMIDDLIGFVKVNTGEWRRKLEPVVLSSFLSSYGKRVGADAELLDRRIECRIDLPSDLAVPMDDRLVLRALENLVNNALRYTSAGGLVRIGARLEGTSLIIEIADDGPGMEAEELTHIFDPFYRGSASRREQGMGLGLSVVKGVVESHGWDISVTAEKGKGSVFRISIPQPEKT
jgi:signal transduction histidine kinase